MKKAQQNHLPKRVPNSDQFIMNGTNQQRRNMHEIDFKLQRDLEVIEMMNEARNIRISNGRESEERDREQVEREKMQLEVQSKIQALALPRRPTKSKLEPTIVKRPKERRVEVGFIFNSEMVLQCVLHNILQLILSLKTMVILIL